MIYTMLILVILLFVLLALCVVLYQRAFFDSITGFLNRRSFYIIAAEIIKKHPAQKYALLITELEYYVTIYSLFGKEEGDRILRYVSKQLQNSAPNVKIARAMEDKFYVLLPVQQDSDVLKYVNTVNEHIRNFHATRNYTNLKVRCGACRSSASPDLSLVMKYAELARTERVKQGTDICFFDERLSDRLRSEKKYIDVMNYALMADEFQVYYQPVYDVKSGAIIGAEALVRWASPEFGFLQPSQFVPVFEKNGFIKDLDFYVLEKVCKMIREQIDGNITPVPVSINQSELCDKDDFTGRFKELIARYRIPADMIQLEMHESAWVSNETCKVTASVLKEAGIHISIDGFGAETFPLVLLEKSCVDILKIARPFWRDIKNEKIRDIMLHKCVDMAGELGISVVCCGVETSEEAESLAVSGGRYMQGFFFSHPLPRADFDYLLKTGGELFSDMHEKKSGGGDSGLKTNSTGKVKKPTVFYPVNGSIITCNAFINIRRSK